MARRGKVWAAHFSTPSGTVRRTYHAIHMGQAYAIANSMAAKEGWRVQQVGIATAQLGAQVPPVKYKGGGFYQPTDE